MKKFIVFAVVLVCFSLIKFNIIKSNYAHAQEVVGKEVTDVKRIVTDEDLIEQFSEQYGADPDIVKKVMDCESGGDHKMSSDGGHSNGIAQFQKSTFNRMSKIFGEKLEYSSKYDQLKLATWALSQPKLAREWTTYVAIKNGGKYSFYSNLNKKHYTVYCKI